MKHLVEKQYENVTLIERADYKWGVIDENGNEIVPFGKYEWIDGFDQGLARVKIGKSANKVNGNKWGIINLKGEEVLPVEYDSVWNFLGKNRYSTTVVSNGVSHDVYFHDLNPEIPAHEFRHSYQDYEESDDYGSHYGEFEGSYAQSVMGYSDDVINDAFEGDPDAYWNID